MISMPNPNKYNGWTNYETWLCNLWFENYDFTDILDIFEDYEERDDILRVITNYIKDDVEYRVEESRESASGFVNDLINAALGEIDYYDIAEHYVDDVMSQLENLDNADEESEEDNQYHYPLHKLTTAA